MEFTNSKYSLFIIVFTTNITHLCICAMIISIDVFAVICFHGCPLTLLEHKYLGKSYINPTNTGNAFSGILYKCNHEYEQSLMLLVSIWLVCTIKCMIILFLKTFNYKLQNYNDIYS